MIDRRIPSRSRRLAAAAAVLGTAGLAPQASAQIDQQFLNVTADTTLSGVGNVVRGPNLTHDPATGRPDPADTIGTTIDAAKLTIDAGATASLAGLRFDATTASAFDLELEVNGQADTSFTYTRSQGGTVTLLADTVFDDALDFVGIGGTGTFRTHTLRGDAYPRLSGSLQIEAERVQNISGMSFSDTAKLTTKEYRVGNVQTSIGGSVVLVADDFHSEGPTQVQGNHVGTPTLTADRLFTSSTLDADSGGVITAGTLEIATGGIARIGGYSGQGGGTIRVTDRAIVNGRLAVRIFGGNPGTLILDPGAVLSGSGTVETLNPFLLGTVAPGNSPGTLSFTNGVTTDASTNLLIELVPTAAPVAGTDNDLIAVTGTATINGGTVRAQQFGGGTFVTGTEYTFLTADNLVVNQELTAVSDVIGVGFSGAYTVGANGMYRLLVGDVVTPNQIAGSQYSTYNRRSVAAGLTELGSGPLIAAFNGASSDAARRTLLDDLSGEIYGTFLTSQIQDAARIFDLVTAQSHGPVWSCANCGTNRLGLSGWMSGYGAGGRIEGDGNARAAEIGVGGTAFGLTNCLDANTSLGAFYGYESSTLRVPQANSSLTADVHRVGVWSRYDAGSLYFRTATQAGFSEAESRRSFAQSGALPLSDSVFGQFDGVTSGTEIEAGRRIGDAAGYLVPAVGLRYLQSNQDGFTETGGDAALTVNDFSQYSLRARAGARAGAALPSLGSLPVAGTLSAFYSRDLNAGAVGDFNAAFAGSPAGSSFNTRGTDFARDRLDVGPGVVFGAGPLKIVTEYQAGLTETSVEHAGQARLEVCF